MKIIITTVQKDSIDFEKCLQIRRIVFIEGQNVQETLEIDGLDKESLQYMISADDIPIGTARVRFIHETAKIERVAILGEYQGKGFGRQLMHFILEDIQRHAKTNSIVLGSQVHAVPFYEQLGFSVCSDVYLDANIPHMDMKLCIK